MNRINKLFLQPERPPLAIYFTAGYPKLSDTGTILQALVDANVDMIEIGFPFSDPIADGPTIQKSSMAALENGMTLPILFEQLAALRQMTDKPVLLMGYLNPVLQYGFEAFCAKCAEVGVDGFIIPDLPLEYYKTHFEKIADKYELAPVFLIAPQTSNERIREIDQASKAFIYMVADSKTTGSKADITEVQKVYFDRVRSMNLKNPLLAGFGISDAESFYQVTRFADAAIIGSAFINAIKDSNSLKDSIHNFIGQVRLNKTDVSV